MGGSPTYQWFLVPYDVNNAVSTNQSLTINPEGGDVASLQTGTYRLYVVVTDGSATASEFIDLSVAQPS